MSEANKPMPTNSRALGHPARMPGDEPRSRRDDRAIGRLPQRA